MAEVLAVGGGADAEAIQVFHQRAGLLGGHLVNGFLGQVGFAFERAFVDQHLAKPRDVMRGENKPPSSGGRRERRSGISRRVEVRKA